VVYKTISCWPSPRAEDLEAFEEYYHAVHVPYAARVPGCLRLVLTRTSDGFETTPPGYYRVAEAWFENKDAFLAATQTDEWNDMRRDAAWVHERFGVNLVNSLGDMVDAPLDPGGAEPDTSLRTR
jgi:uncharacterized protein (TIGR02118 family)